MTAPAYIEHVTLTTGHVRRSPRSEVGEEAIAVLRPVIERITAGPVAASVPIPAAPGYSISGRGEGRCLVAVVWADGPPSVAVASIGVAGHSRCGAQIWRALHDCGETPVVTDRERQPPVPWCGVALDAGILQHLDATEWLGDFERCLAWAWLDIRQRG